VDAGEQCDHPDVVDGRCAACGCCLHEVVLNRVCYFCGEVDPPVTVKPEPASPVVSADRLRRRP
jgi:hypothetical protein